MPPQKPGLHPRNRHNGRYDLATLCQVTPELTQFLTLTPGGEQSVDFANPQAVKALNKALLAHYYAVQTGISRKVSCVRRFRVVRTTFTIWPTCWVKLPEPFRQMRASWT